MKSTAYDPSTESTESCVWLYLDGLLEHQQNAVVPADSDMIFSTGGLLEALLDLAEENDNLRVRLAVYEI
jgi:hypothetical protein